MERRIFLKITGQVAIAGTALFVTGCGGGGAVTQNSPTPVPTPTFVEPTFSQPTRRPPTPPGGNIPTDMQLFLLIGQSNMAGRGAIEAQDRATDPGIYAMNKEMKFVLAKDPIHFDKSVAGVGPGHQFARTLKAKDPGANIGLIPAAVGGTSLAQWAPGGALYNNAVTRARAAMKNGTLKGILWHQGESDSQPDRIKSYNADFAKMISQLRTDLGATNVPVIVGQLYAPGNQVRADFNTNLLKVPDVVPNSRVVPSAGLTANPDNTHFDTPGARELGRRYAVEYQKFGN